MKAFLTYILVLAFIGIMALNDARAVIIDHRIGHLTYLERNV
jgi:hypothetical protein